jgi:hypothetical protein
MMINECGAVGGMEIGGGNRRSRRKPGPVPFWPLQISHDMTWDRTLSITHFQVFLALFTSFSPSLFVSFRVYFIYFISLHLS